jgi:hypothetical protein
MKYMHRVTTETMEQRAKHLYDDVMIIKMDELVLVLWHPGTVHPHAQLLVTITPIIDESVESENEMRDAVEDDL